MPQQCQKCECYPQATRNHIIVCSGVKRDIVAFMLPAQLGGDNILDASPNNAKIWRKVRKGFQEVWGEYLGRMWNSGHERNLGAEQKVYP